MEFAAFAKHTPDFPVMMAMLSPAAVKQLEDRKPLVEYGLELLSDEDLDRVVLAWSESGLIDALYRGSPRRIEKSLLRRSPALWRMVRAELEAHAFSSDPFSTEDADLLDLMKHHSEDKTDLFHELQVHVEAASKQRKEIEQRWERERVERERRASEARERMRREREQAIQNLSQLAVAQRIERMLGGTLDIEPPYPDTWLSLPEADAIQVPLELQRQVVSAARNRRSSDLWHLHVALHRFRSEKRRREYQAFIVTVKAMSRLQQVTHLATETVIVYWYPRELANWIEQHAADLNPDLRNRLEERFMGIGGKVWRRAKAAVRSPHST